MLSEPDRLLLPMYWISFCWSWGNNCWKVVIKMKKTLLFICTLLLHSLVLLAQNKTVKGSVWGDGEPLIGATVMLKGSTVGTITDINGNFTLEISDSENAVIECSYVGFQTQTIPYDGQDLLQITLQPNTEVIEEVVVVAYGSQKKADLTSSISVINADEVASVPVANLSQAIQGKAAGVTVVQSGIPGADASIRIRGTNSVNSTEPLYVVDGIPGAPAPNPNDVESLQILKDAATCALYGARGSNGVIVITTKKGSKGKPRVDYSGYVGWQYPNNIVELLDANEYIQFVNENYQINQLGGQYANGYNLIPKRVQEAMLHPETMQNTDWFGELYRMAPMTKHSLSVASGSEHVSNYISLNYLNQQGIQVSSGFESFNLQVNTDVRYGIFHLGESLNLYSKTSKNTSSQAESALRNTPLIPIYNSENEGGFDGASDSMDNINPSNPLASIALNPASNRNEGLSGNVYMDFTILKNFIFKASQSLKINYNSQQEINLPHVAGSSSLPNTAMEQYRGRDLSSATELTLTYARKFNEHNLNVMAGYTWEYGLSENMTGSADKFNVRLPVSFASKASDAVMVVGGGWGEWAIESFLARILYDYKGKYLFTGNFRRDGSSKFGANNRYANFPSFSAGWRISEEDFMEPTRSVLDNLKIRASWGLLGSQFGIGNYEKDVSLQTTAVYVLNNTIVPGTTLNKIVNDDLRWEEQSTVDVGVDLDMFNQILSFTGDYFYKKTTGMLIDVPVPTSGGLGYNSSMLLNAGDVQNWGVELALTARKNRGEFTCDATANFTLERNKVLQLGTANLPITGGQTQRFGEGITRTEVGHPLGMFYGYQMEGIYQIGDSDIPDGLAPGDIRFKDISGPDGVPDGQITADDRTFIGNPFPAFTCNLGFNAYWKGFDFSIFLQGVYGSDIFNETRYWTEGMKDFHQQGKAVLERWTPTNPSNTMPRAVQGNAYNLQISDRFVEDGSFLRLKNLSLGYTIPAEIMQKIHVQKARVYVMGQNLATLTRYSGFDPEIRNTADSWIKAVNMYNGIDRSVYPVAASFFVGLELSF